MKKVSFVSFLLLFTGCSIAFAAAAPPVRTGTQGEVRYEELLFQPRVIYAPGWNLARILPGEVKTDGGVFRCGNGLLVAGKPDGTLEWEAGPASAEGFRYRLRFAVPDLAKVTRRYVDMQISDDDALKLDWRESGGKAGSLAFGKGSFQKTGKVDSVTLSLKNGIVYDFRPKGASLWVQDNRSWDKDAGFSVRFEACESDTVVLEVRRRAAAVRPIDIGDAANRTFADPAANDGKGGWTDQGPGNDMSVFREKQVKYKNLAFDIAGEEKSGKPGVIVVAGPERNMAPQEISLTLPAGIRARGLALLHASGWISTNRIGEIVVRYADTGTQTIPVNGGAEVGNWWVSGDFANAKVAWSAHNGTRTVGMYASCFELSGSEPVSITFRIVHPEAIWLIAGVTLTERPLFLPAHVAKPLTAAPDKEWRPIKYERRVTPGSPLDFTGIAVPHKPAGTFGHAVVSESGTVVFEKAPGQRIRLNGVNLCETALQLSNKEAEELAVFLAAQGINAVRFHHHDNNLVDPNAPDSVTLNPRTLDRLEYLAAKLKEQGIYLTFDVYVSRQLKPGDNLELFKRYPDYLKTGHTGAKNAFLFADDAFENWKTFARRWLTHVNPYTGLSLAEDPAVLFVNLINEDTIGNVWNHTPGSVMHRFLADEYARHCAAHPGLDPAPRLGNKDYAGFLYTKTRDRYREMTAFLRNELKAGFLVTSANNGGDLASTWLRDSFDVVDDHIYSSHPMFPETAWRLPMEFSQSSVIGGHAWVPLNLFRGRIYGKPFFITEFNFCAPNVFRAEDGPLMGAYCALNDIDGIFRFNFSSSRERLNGQIKKMVVFESCYDPVAQTSDRITAALFVRGDVAPAPVKAACTIPRNLFAEARDYGFPPLETSGLINQVGAVFDDRPVPGVRDHRNLADPRALAGYKRYRETKVAESVTGQIRLDPERGTLQISTPKSAVVTLPKGSATDGALKVENADTFQTFAAISLDGAELAKSGSVVVLQSTDMVTTGIRFADQDRRRVEAVGDGPLLMRRGTARLSLATDGPRKIAAVDFQGDALGEIPASWKNGVLTFDADNCRFENGVAGYHITRE